MRTFTQECEKDHHFSKKNICPIWPSSQSLTLWEMWMCCVYMYYPKNILYMSVSCVRVHWRLFYVRCVLVVFHCYVSVVCLLLLFFFVFFCRSIHVGVSFCLSPLVVLRMQSLLRCRKITVLVHVVWILGQLGIVSCRRDSLLPSPLLIIRSRKRRYIESLRRASKRETKGIRKRDLEGDTTDSTASKKKAQNTPAAAKTYYFVSLITYFVFTYP